MDKEIADQLYSALRELYERVDDDRNESIPSGDYIIHDAVIYDANLQQKIRAAFKAYKSQNESRRFISMKEFIEASLGERESK